MCQTPKRPMLERGSAPFAGIVPVGRQKRRLKWEDCGRVRHAGLSPEWFRSKTEEHEELIGEGEGRLRRLFLHGRGTFCVLRSVLCTLCSRVSGRGLSTHATRTTADCGVIDNGVGPMRLFTRASVDKSGSTGRRYLRKPRPHRYLLRLTWKSACGGGREAVSDGVLAESESMCTSRK